jgi:predicted Fe-Mo cluster-binding NifX family protein
MLHRLRLWVPLITIIMLTIILVSMTNLYAPPSINSNPGMPTTPTLAQQQSEINSTIVFTGDIMLARSIGEGIKQGHNPFTAVQSKLDQYDLRVANLETTVADPAIAHKAPGKLYAFNAPLQSIATLKQAGIDVVNLANNHTGDYGKPATADMLQRLNKAEIRIAGAGGNTAEAFSPLIINLPQNIPAQSPENAQIKVALIAFNDIETAYTNSTPTSPGSAYFDESLLLQSIQQARQQQTDVIFALPHWGVEYSPQPSAHQRSMAQWLIDNGVDMVIGNHPHVIQPIEEHKGKYIVYSLGNFVFDQMSGADLGQLIEVTIRKSSSSDHTSPPSITLSAPLSIRTKLDSRGFPTLPP